MRRSGSSTTSRGSSTSRSCSSGSSLRVRCALPLSLPRQPKEAQAVCTSCRRHCRHSSSSSALRLPPLLANLQRVQHATVQSVQQQQQPVQAAPTAYAALRHCCSRRRLGCSCHSTGGQISGPAVVVWVPLFAATGCR